MDKREARREAKFRAGLIIESALANGYGVGALTERYGGEGAAKVEAELTALAARLIEISGGGGVPTIELSDYHDEVARHADTRPDDYHPATAREPRRLLTRDGAVLGGSNNGEGRGDWSPRHNVTVHVAVTGSGYAYGASVAACDGTMELSEQADGSSLVELRGVDARLLCGRPGCRALIRQGGA